MSTVKLLFVEVPVIPVFVEAGGDHLVGAVGDQRQAEGGAAARDDGARRAVDGRARRRRRCRPPA